MIQSWLLLATIYFLNDQTERMGEHALTTREPPSLVALAHSSLLVNAVRMIFVNFTHAKIMGLVLSILLMATKQQHATVQKILMDQIVTCCFAVLIEHLVIIVVNVYQISQTQLSLIFWNTIRISIWNTIRKTIWNTILISNTMILENCKIVNAVKRME